ncbi:MAG: hypothetical protein QUS09_00210 [Methanotrichaceae archaeon]|nr:hypothetical protein [Methanotrichaceae archaeon]
MKAWLIVILAVYLGVTLCSFGLAASPMQSVGGEFGQNWLTQYSNKFVTASSNNTNDLWKWGGKPRGYDVFQGKLYSLLAPTEIYYPGFVTNTTPIFVNGTALMRNQRFLYWDYIAPDYMASGFMSDPWLLAQMTERPVVVMYPDENRRSTLH